MVEVFGCLTVSMKIDIQWKATYDKGAAIVHSMRYMIMDDPMFFQILKDFQIEYADGTAYGVDFKNALETASGQDFTAFLSNGTSEKDIQPTLLNGSKTNPIYYFKLITAPQNRM